jgi:hypothetical protein
MTRTIFLIMCCAVAAEGDTVTMNNHVSVNGNLKQVSSGVITLDAGFPAGTKTLSIPLSAVDTIGFNSTTANPGAPPKALTTGASPGGGAADVTVVLRAGGQRKDCKLQSIDANAIHCAAKGGDYNRKTVLRILVGAP